MVRLSSIRRAEVKLAGIDEPVKITYKRGNKLIEEAGQMDMNEIPLAGGS